MSDFKYEFSKEQLCEIVECITVCELNFDEAMDYITSFYDEIKTPLDPED